MLIVYRMLTIFIIVSCVACSKANDATPACKADGTTSISYQNDIVPILKANCLQCHDAANHFGGIVLATYADVEFSARVGELYGTIQGDYPSMPKGGKLTACEIATIKQWIDQGIKDN